MASQPVLTFTDKGIYCPAGDFYIDPSKPVDRALITHGHSDHARRGHTHYLATSGSAPILRHRLGKIDLETLEYGARQKIGDALVSFHPAGHVPGSAQIRVEVAGRVWVVSGDYKTGPDDFCTPFEPVACHSFITESTFALPVFRWPDQHVVAGQINDWWRQSLATGTTPVLAAYSFGKAQRLLSLLDPGIGQVLTHHTVEAITQLLRDQGYVLPRTIPVTSETALKDHPDALLLAPPAALSGEWIDRFRPVSAGFASGWMQLRGMRRRRSMDRGFVLSDHADWPGLNSAIRETGAEHVFVTHGYTAPFARWLCEQGYDARVLQPGHHGQPPL